MKRTILTISFLALFTLLNCKNETKSSINEPSNSEENFQNRQKKQRKKQGEEEGDGWKHQIKLNKGEKWSANPETNEGVLKMQRLIKDSPKQTLEDYRKLATELNEVKNHIIKECTMEGASHDNLHIWLYPLIRRIDNLIAADNLSKANNITVKISEILNDYHSYFK